MIKRWKQGILDYYEKKASCSCGQDDAESEKDLNTATSEECCKMAQKDKDTTGSKRRCC